MLCPKCNQELPEDSTFCNHCGADLNLETQPTSPQELAEVVTDFPAPSEPPLKKKKPLKLLLGIGGAALVLLIIITVLVTSGGSPVDKYDKLLAKGSFDEAHSFLAEQNEETIKAIDAKANELKDAQKVFVTSAGYTQYVDDVYGLPMGSYDPRISISNKSDMIITSYVIVYRFCGLGKLPLSDYLEMSDTYANLLPTMDYTLSEKCYTSCSSTVESVEACVKEITFSIGGKWENPYYPYWRAAN